MTPFFSELASKFDGTGVKAIVLMGSHARREAGPFSDIDLVRFTDEHLPPPADTGSHLINEHLVVVSNVKPSETERWFTEPQEAVKVIEGVRRSRILIDRDHYFANLQAQAQAFVWDKAMQKKANHWASQQLVGWIEEVHKGLEGLRRGDIGRMLNARFGLSWGLSSVMQVQRGILISGDNDFYEQIAHALGEESEWIRLRRLAFGIGDNNHNAPTLPQQVIAGLQLYALTAEQFADALQPDDKPLIMQTVALIRQNLREQPLLEENHAKSSQSNISTSHRYRIRRYFCGHKSDFAPRGALFLWDSPTKAGRRTLDYGVDGHWGGH